MTSSGSYAMYLGVILFAFIVGVFRFSRLQNGAKMIVVLLGCTLLSEYVADLLSVKYRNNMVVYHVYAPLHLFLVAVYFNQSIPSFRRRHVGWYIGAAGFIVALINSMFLQSTSELNSYYLLFAGFVIISMSLYAFYKILENDNTGTWNNPHFWISFILLFFWSITYLNWSVYQMLSKSVLEYMALVGFALPIISAITYFGFGLVFLFYPKTIKVER
ncbi:MAG: hypothetical protein K0R82_2773 [Flavipsychrobacter sp.]|jgi:hypothetical protein|nr:hypothetical protein [Flavipsychrobacter sp.]